ncbi:hypothetical protein crov094 [Cafeteria roenbergensis virus]|uniref:Uncharacterized protein n=1 Tax=Cafeteria roenbergensis virus (strain BV-PW1) TaxID=693272 RepID=E3T4L4_CROVB|nr:hypothetical protein crov094 [Cafeteria roenbergensis virus BV-PW1]ADO67127.1 hypothetical protein crov094 [Cafeteria roenbergensis virus BV-PW1]
MTVTHRFEHNEVHGSGDNKTTIKKNIVDGTEGLGVRFLHKSPKAFHMVTIKESEPGKFMITEKKEDKEEKMEVDLKGLEKFIKASKLDFLGEYLKVRAKELKGGSMNSYMKSKSGVSATKKSSKKATKKSSKKATKKSSKKATKKSSKKATKKSSKKATKKSSKKSSKKTSDDKPMKLSKKTMKKSSRKSKKTTK